MIRIGASVITHHYGDLNGFFGIKKLKGSLTANVSITSTRNVVAF